MSEISISKAADSYSTRPYTRFFVIRRGENLGDAMIRHRREFGRGVVTCVADLNLTPARIRGIARLG